MKTKLIGILTLAALLLCVSACGVTYHGRVIDADTKLPIVGAVVVASWLEERGTAAGGTSRLNDVKETLTDNKGDWSIKGPKGTSSECLTTVYTIFTFFTGAYYTETPGFVVFKPGYCSFPHGFEIEACKDKMKTYSFGKSEYLGEIVELPKLTGREDRRKNSNISLPDNKNMQKKVINLIRLLDEEDEYLYPGLQNKSMYKELLREFNHER